MTTDQQKLAYAEAYVNRLMEVWSQPGVERFDELLHPGGTVHHSGMEHPLCDKELRDYLARVKSAFQGIQIRDQRWAVNGDDVFIEWVATATLLGQPFTFEGIDRATLRDGKVVDSIARFDRVPMLERFDPSTKRPNWMLENLTPT